MNCDPLSTKQLFAHVRSFRMCVTAQKRSYWTELQGNIVQETGCNWTDRAIVKKNIC